MARIRKIPTNENLIKEISESVCPVLSAALVYSIMHNIPYDKMLVKSELGQLPQGINMCYSRTAFYRFRRQVLATYKFMGGYEICPLLSLKKSYPG